MTCYLSFLAQDVLGSSCIFLSQHWNQLFLQGRWLILVEMVFRSQDLDAECAHCYQGKTSQSLSAERGRECRYEHTYNVIHRESFVSLFIYYFKKPVKSV